MLIERVAVRLVELPLVEPFVAAHGTMTVRELVVVEIDSDEGHGWGECSALPEASYTDEFAAGAFMVIDEELAPRLVGHDLSADGVQARLSLVSGNPMAKAALEMAVLDIELRRDGQSLADRLGAKATHVRAGAAVGLCPVDAIRDRVAALADDGFGRVKLKVAPGHDLDAVSAAQVGAPSIEVQVDGNGAYEWQHIGHLVELAQSGVTAVEQPFAVDDEGPTAELVERSPVPIVADEAASSTVEVGRLYEMGAVSGVSIKPPRIGGIGPAVALHDWCADHGVPATAGGMVESGLGRHALAALAALPGFTLTGDVSPARRWLAADPWPDLQPAEELPGELGVPAEPGVAPDPDRDLLDHHTTRSGETRA